METQSKKWYQSKTIWGIVIAFIGYAISQFLKVPDLQIPENADMETIKKHIEAVKAAKNDFMLLASELMAAIGSVIAIIGRIKADQKIG